VRRERRKFGVVPPAKYVAVADAPPVTVVNADAARAVDAPSRSALARIYLDEQRIAGRLADVTGPELQRESGLAQSHARTVLREYRRAIA
jgi:hypothetical protein